MFLFYVLNFSKKGDTIQGEHFVMKYGSHRFSSFLNDVKVFNDSFFTVIYKRCMIFFVFVHIIWFEFEKLAILL